MGKRGSRNARGFALAVAALFVILALATAAFWWLRPNLLADPASSAPARSDTSDATGERRSSDDRAIAGVATRERLAGAEFAAPTHSGLPECVVGPADGFRVRVVAAGDHSSIANARVYLVPCQDAMAEQWAYSNARMLIKVPLFDFVQPFFADPTRLVDAGARGFVADANGEARIVWPHRASVLIGFADGLRGARQLFVANDVPFLLPLGPGVDLTVEVVMPDGKPVAAAFVACARQVSPSLLDQRLQLRSEAGKPSAGPLLTIPLHAGVATDDHGLARLIGLECIAAMDERVPLPSSAPFGIAVPYFGSQAVAAFVEVPDLAALRGHARIVLDAPFGVIEARVVDRQGHPRRIAGQVEANLATPDRAPLRIEETAATRQRRPLEAGLARFLPVALGARFDVALELVDLPSPVKSIEGPKAAGEVVRVDFDPESERRELVGRLVGFDEPPGANASLVATPFGWMMQGVPARLLEGGRFRIDATSIARQQVHHIAVSGLDRDREVGFDAVIPLEEELTSPETDVGDIPIRRRPMLVSGRVVDERHEPVAQVELRVMSVDASESGFRFSFSENFESTATTGADGRFVLVGPVVWEEWKLVATPPPGYVAEPIRFKTGARDVEVVLARTGTIVGTIAAELRVALYAKPRDRMGAIPELTPSGTWNLVGDRRDERGEDPARERSFVFELPSGRYDLFATLSPGDWQAQIVAHVGDVEVRGGETTRDPRLSPMVADGRLAPWKIVVERTDGAPPPSVWIRIAPRDDPAKIWQTVYAATGEAIFDMILDPAWIDVFAVSFRHVHALHPRGEVHVRLEPVDQREVTIELTVADVPAATRLRWRVVAEPAWPLPDGAADRYSAAIAAGGRAQLQLDEGEQWRLRLFAERESGAGSGRAELTRLAREVPEDAGATTTLRFDVRPNEIDDALRQLETR